MNLSTELNLITKLIENFDNLTVLNFLNELILKTSTNEIDIYKYNNIDILIIKKNKNDYWETHTNLQPNNDIKTNRHFKKCFKIIKKYFDDKDDNDKVYLFAPASYLQELIQMYDFYAMPLNIDDDKNDLKITDLNLKISKNQLKKEIKKYKISINITNLTKKQMKIILNQLKND